MAGWNDSRLAPGVPISAPVKLYDAARGCGFFGPATPDPASGQPIRAIVKWYVPAKGYGFLAPVDGLADLFCNAAVVEASSRQVLPQGAAATCEIVQGEKGPQVSRIITVEPVAENNGDAVNGPPRPVSREQAWHERESAGPSVEVLGTVKFFDPVRGFGFVVPDDGGAPDLSTSFQS